MVLTFSTAQPWLLAIPFDQLHMSMAQEACPSFLRREKTVVFEDLFLTLILTHSKQLGIPQHLVEWSETVPMLALTHLS